jgi:hypothetical protein
MEPGKDYVLIRDGEEPTDRQLAVLTGKHNIFWNNKYYCCFLEGKCWLQTSYPRNVLTMIAKKCFNHCAGMLSNLSTWCSHQDCGTTAD